ncbi:MAG: SdiA-regulated domain-containing protein [Myxococcales bacterium]|nr:SdiA-regulated domain-containing protein [Myxococcales bacterium]
MGKRPKERVTLPAVVEESWALGVQEASAVAPLADGSLLVVDDEQGVFHCRRGETPVVLAATAGLADLEGLCLDPAGERAWVLAERDGSVWRYQVEGGDFAAGERLGKLPRLSKTKNQGWEGLALAPAGLFGETAKLLAAHQRKPRVVGVFDPDDLHEEALLPIPKDAKKLLGDLNDLAVDPRNGHLFVLSGKAGLLAELRHDDGSLVTHRMLSVAASKRDVPEGLAFDRGGRLWLVTDGEGWLRRIAVDA